MRIYVAYADDGARDISEHLVDELAHRYGQANVQATLTISNDKSQERAIERAAVVLVVIGPWWAQTITRTPLGATIVRVIATALQTNKMIVPVLVQGASIPDVAQLPAPIAGIAHRQSLALRPDPAMTEDLDRLFGEINTQLNWAPMHGGLIIGAAVMLIAQSAYVIASYADNQNVEAALLFPLAAWATLFFIYSLRVAFTRKSWVWAIALVGSLAASVVSGFINQPEWSGILEFYAFAVILTLFGLFGPRRELQKLQRGSV